MVVPIALIAIGAILILSASRGQSITDLINGVSPSDSGKDDGSLGGLFGTTGSGGDDTDVSTDSHAFTVVPSVVNIKPQVIDGIKVAGWIAYIVRWARAHGWTGVVTSGIRSDEQQRQACINVCGNPNGCPGTCAKPGTSNHRGTIFPSGAVDVTNYVQFASVLKNYPGGPPIINDLPSDLGHFSRTGH